VGVNSSPNISPTLTPNRLRNEVKLATLYIEYKNSGKSTRDYRLIDTLPTTNDRAGLKQASTLYDTHSPPEKDCRSLDNPNTTGP
jgi:hypothetical protein